MYTGWKRRRAMRLALGAIAISLVGCASPHPSVTLTPSPVAQPPDAPSPTVAASAPPALVEAPPIECDHNTSIWFENDAHGSQVPIVITLTCENAVAAAMDLVGPNPAIDSIEFHFGWYCPPGAFCAVTQPNTGHVIFHFNRRQSDTVVSVTADAAGKVTASDARTLSPAGGAP